MRSLPVTRGRPRRAFSLFSAFALLIALLTLASVGVDRSAALDGETEAVPGELIVGFTSSATAWQDSVPWRRRGARWKTGSSPWTPRS